MSLLLPPTWVNGASGKCILVSISRVQLGRATPTHIYSNFIVHIQKNAQIGVVLQFVPTCVGHGGSVRGLPFSWITFTPGGNEAGRHSKSWLPPICNHWRDVSPWKQSSGSLASLLLSRNSLLREVSPLSRPEGSVVSWLSPSRIHGSNVRFLNKPSGRDVILFL